MDKEAANLIMGVSQEILREAMTVHMTYLERHAFRFRQCYNRASVPLPGLLEHAEEAEREAQAYGNALREVGGDPEKWFAAYGGAARDALIYFHADTTARRGHTEGIEFVQSAIKGANA